MTINFFMAAQVIGETDTAGILEVSAVVFDPETAEVGGKGKEFHRIVDIQSALCHGTVDARSLTLFVANAQFRPQMISMHSNHDPVGKVVADLANFVVNAKGDQTTEHVRVYSKFPAYHLPPIMRMMRDWCRIAVPWPSYGVICAKTIQDIARPRLVALGVDTPSRPPTRDGLLDDMKHEAIITMHSLAVLNGTHPKQTGRNDKERSKKIGTPAVVVPDDEDDEL